MDGEAIKLLEMLLKEVEGQLEINKKRSKNVTAISELFLAQMNLEELIEIFKRIEKRKSDEKNNI